MLYWLGFRTLLDNKYQDKGHETREAR
jgi:hypothetical protein